MLLVNNIYLFFFIFVFLKQQQTRHISTEHNNEKRRSLNDLPLIADLVTRWQRTVGIDATPNNGNWRHSSSCFQKAANTGSCQLGNDLEICTEFTACLQG
jgi:hypothetical protein